jgi:hypothetical protein
MGFKRGSRRLQAVESAPPLSATPKGKAGSKARMAASSDKLMASAECGNSGPKPYLLAALVSV